MSYVYAWTDAHEPETGPPAMCAGCFGRDLTGPHDCQGDPCWCLCRYGDDPEPPDTLREMREPE